jgi:hypothetical protein
MALDPDRFEKIASGVQSCVFALAVVIGGGWTLYVFNSQLQVQNAQAQLQKLTRELQEEPRVELSMTVRQMGSIDGGKRLVVGNIVVKNVGTANTALVLGESALVISRVRFDERDDEKWDAPQRVRLFMGYHLEIGNLVAQVGAANSASFAAVIRDRGLYVATFTADRQPKEKRATVEAGAKEFQPNQEVAWQTQAYFFVQ